MFQGCMNFEVLTLKILSSITSIMVYIVHKIFNPKLFKIMIPWKYGNFQNIALWVQAQMAFSYVLAMEKVLIEVKGAVWCLQGKPYNGGLTSLLQLICGRG